MKAFKKILLKSKNTPGLSVSLNWDCGEGLNGDYDEDDPEDVRLLRFDVSYRHININKDYFPMDGSFCTRLSADDKRPLLVKAAQIILAEAERCFYFDGFADEVKLGKRQMEELSWLTIENGKVV